MAIVIKVENVSKQYRLGSVGSGTLRDDLTRWWYGIRGKKDPLMQIGSTNDRTQKADSDYVWALKDINFEVQQGDVLGIIGRNGAGKSTLLKILSKTTAPTTGSAKLKGRIASLLEVGTGFHPELTGRENIYLNGAILGMRKHEITRKLDEIVDFAGVERYLDTPVKRYSSGMYVRLAFGVAAHLESEILIIDEVLAVGDAEFQKKCLGKMGEVSKGEGRTVLFVSHNMAGVKSLCTRALYLDKGIVEAQGSPDAMITRYLVGDSVIQNFRQIHIEKNNMRIESVGVKINKKEFHHPLTREGALQIHVQYEKNSSASITFTLKFKGEDGQYFMVTSSSHYPEIVSGGRNTAIIEFPDGMFNEGNYYMDLLVVENGRDVIILENDVIGFYINPEERPLGSWMGKEVGYMRGNFIWKSQKT
jgi:lipopolysaccharide transport system ATP-binding protein